MMEFTDFEEGIAFDQDDPDFVNGNVQHLNRNKSNNNYNNNNNNYIVGPMTCRSAFYNCGNVNRKAPAGTVLVSSPMSISRVETMRMLNKSQSLSLSSISSLDDAHISFSVANSSNSSTSIQEPVMVSIEELRLQLNSCFTCGVSWHEDHVSLDCQECGGYSLERPCPCCDGRCKSTWKRDLTMSHATSKARWEGKCLLSTSTQMLKTIVKEDESHLCSRLEKLTASS